MLRGDVIQPRGLSAEYPVSQLNVAAFLVLAGPRLLRLEPVGNGRRFCQFVFERDSRIAEDRMRFYEREGHVEARGLAEALANLKKTAMEKLQEKTMKETEKE